MDGISTSELARRGGVNLASVRFYERSGLLPTPPRTAAGYRRFPEAAVDRIRFIKQAQTLGFSLEEVRELIGLWLDPHVQCADVRRRAERKVVDIERRIAALRSVKRALDGLVAACSCRGRVGHCPLLEALRSPGKSNRRPRARE